jgi:hypothetical protein
MIRKIFMHNKSIIMFPHKKITNKIKLLNNKKKVRLETLLFKIIKILQRFKKLCKLVEDLEEHLVLY